VRDFEEAACSTALISHHHLHLHFNMLEASKLRFFAIQEARITFFPDLWCFWQRVKLFGNKRMKLPTPDREAEYS
jgi:hypothetical protein